MGYTHDALISSNSALLKRHLSRITGPLELMEIARALSICGDKSVSVCKQLFDCKEILESSPEACWAVLTAAAVVSCEGNSITEGALMLRKIESIPEFHEHAGVSAERKLLVTLGLSPGHSQSAALIAAVIAESSANDSSKLRPPVERLRFLLDSLGLSDAELDSFADGVRVDACFAAQRTVILVESDPLFNVSVKRFQTSGMTALRTSVLSRRGWKVVSFVSELHPDDKIAAAHLLDHLRKIPYTAVANISSVEDSKKLVSGQRLKLLKVRNLAMVDVARFLLSVLRGNLIIDNLDLAELGMTDYVTEVICEFALTYISRNPLAKIDLSDNQLSVGFLQRLLHSLKGLGSLNRSIEVVLNNNKIEKPLPSSEQTYPVKLVLGPNPGTPDSGITVYLIGI
jgi:hypothetical protein